MAKTNVVDGNNAVIMDSVSNAKMVKSNGKAKDVPEANLTADEVAIQVRDIVKPSADAFKNAMSGVSKAETVELKALFTLGDAWDKAWLTFKANRLTKTKDFYPYCADSIGVSVKSIEVYMRVIKHRDVLEHARSIRESIEMIKNDDYSDPTIDAEGNKAEAGGKPERLTDERRLIKIIAEIAKLDNIAKCKAELLEGIAKVERGEKVK